MRWMASCLKTFPRPLAVTWGKVGSCPMSLCGGSCKMWPLNASDSSGDYQWRTFWVLRAMWKCTALQYVTFGVTCEKCGQIAMQDEENGAHVIYYVVKCSERKGSLETGLRVVQNLSCIWMPVFIQGVSFPSTAALRHRYPVSAGTSRDMWHAQRNDKRCSFGLKMAVGKSPKCNIHSCLVCLIHSLC